MININELKELVISDNIEWSQHVDERMIKRRINVADVIECIMNGEIIEQYPEDYPHPSCLVFAYVINNRPIHTVVGLNKGEMEVVIITTYEPDKDKWKNNFKERVKNNV